MRRSFLLCVTGFVSVCTITSAVLQYCYPHARHWRHLALIFALCFVLNSFIALIVAQSRVHVPPFAQRCLPLVSVGIIACNLILVWSNVKLLVDVPIEFQCTMHGWVCNVVSVATILPYIVRAWRLHAIFNHESHPKWMDRLSDRRLCIIFMALMIPGLALTLCQILSSSVATSTRFLYSSCTDDNISSRWASLVCNILGFLVLLFFLLSLRGVWFGFGIQSELSFFIGLQLFFIATDVWLLTAPNTRDPVDLLVVIRAVMCSGISLSLPLFHSYSLSHSIPLTPRPESAYTLQGVLSDPICFDFFARFMQDDRDSVLLEFYVESKLFEDERCPKSRRRKARHIFDIYLGDRGSLTRFLDPYSKPILAIDERICGSSSLPDSLFSHPLTIVCSQMQNYSLRRFRLSAEFVQMMQELRRQLLIRDRLAHSDLIDRGITSPVFGTTTPLLDAAGSPSFTSPSLQRGVASFIL